MSDAVNQLQTEIIYETNCEVCDEIITLDSNVELNELLECSTCGSEFEVVSLDPIELQEAPMEAEDWGQ
jgi:alpha-aminoadipate/glutamate carrier protein LysW